MEELLSAIETGSVDKVKEVIDNTSVSPTAYSKVSLYMSFMFNVNIYINLLINMYSCDSS